MPINITWPCVFNSNLVINVNIRTYTYVHRRYDGIYIFTDENTVDVHVNTGS